MEKSHKSLIKSTGIISLATFFSRILGFVRDMVIANMFGTKMAADAFFVAFRIPNLLRRLFGEGALSASFIPVFTEHIHRKSKEAAWELASNALCIASTIVISVTVLGVVFAPVIVKTIAPGFGGGGAKHQLTVLLTRITFPYIFCISIAALMMGILNSLHHFTAPALSPALLNISIIGSALLLGPRLEQPVIALAVGVLAGGILQLFFQIPFLIKKGMKFKARLNFKHPGIKRIGVLMMPAMLGTAVYEINNLIDTLLASLLPGGSISYLYYGNRLVQFPLGVFGVALGTALLPTLSHQAAKGELSELTETFSFSLRTVLYICLPAMIGLIVLRKPIIQLLFQRGEFGAQAAAGTATALLYYSLGLWAYAGVKIVVPVFHSMQDTKTPVRISTISLLVNIVLNVILMRFMQHAGLALATALSSMLNLTWLVIALRKRLGVIGGRKILISFLRTSLAALVMGGICQVGLQQSSWAVSNGVFSHIGFLALLISLGMGSFTFLSYLLGSEEFHFFAKIIKSKIS